MRICSCREEHLILSKHIDKNIFGLYTAVYMKVNEISNRELLALREIRNSLMHKGKMPSTRELMSSLGYRSPRSAAVIYETLAKKGILRRKRDGSFQVIKGIGDDTIHAQTVDVPLVGSISCGVPILANENVEAVIPVSTKLAKFPYKYFLLRAKGDSMDQKGICDGDLVLVRQQATAKDRDIVVALIDDEATIKEFHTAGETVVLKPRSKNKIHQPIVLTKDFQVQGIVVTAIPKI